MHIKTRALFRQKIKKPETIRIIRSAYQHT